MHRIHCMQLRHRVRCTRRMPCLQGIHRTHRKHRFHAVPCRHLPYSVCRMHAGHARQRKRAAGRFPHLVTLWHSQAVCSSCPFCVFMVILHPEQVP